jgi:hypothetical protein
MLTDNIVTVLINFATYIMFHKDFRQDLITMGMNIADGLITDLASPTMPYPPNYNLALPD